MIEPEVLNALPLIRRARGERLYGAAQNHWIDLWKQGGAWFFGHRPEGAAQAWKNAVDKGLATWLPSKWPDRLLPFVQRLVPGTICVRVFRNIDRVSEARYWRPWMPVQDLGANSVPLVLVLPSGPTAAVAVAYRDPAYSVPVQELVSPADSAAVVQAAVQVLRFQRDARYEADTARVCRDFDHFIAGSEVFERNGQWFRLQRPEEFRRVFREHLDFGFLLSPDPHGWNIVPRELSRGEWKSWSKCIAGLGAP